MWLLADYVGIRRNGGKGTSDFICTYTSNRSDSCRASAGRAPHTYLPSLVGDRLTVTGLSRGPVQLTTHESFATRRETSLEAGPPRFHRTIEHSTAAQYCQCGVPHSPRSGLVGDILYLVCGIWRDIDKDLLQVTGHSAGCLPTPETRVRKSVYVVASAYPHSLIARSTGI